MDPALLALLLCNLALIGALPRVFFRAGKLTLRWWATAAPFFASAVLLLLTPFGLLVAWPAIPEPWPAALSVASAVLSAGSLALIGFAMGTNRVPLSLWHQEGDAPSNLVTFGAYKRIRHPFYASFLLTLVAVLLAVPHPATLALLAYGVLVLNATAAGEERRFLASPLGKEYAAYRLQAGRFVPKWPGGRT